MRRALLVLIPLMLAGCMRDSATHYIASNTHTITVRAEQEYFWDDRVKLTLAVARLPECQRVFPMTLADKDVVVQLYATGEDTFTVKAPEGTWTFETQRCTLLQPAAAPGQLIGTYSIDGTEMKFAPAQANALPSA